MRELPAAIILAAGRSSRMGRPKALLPWTPERQLIEHLHECFASAGCAPVIHVTGGRWEEAIAARAGSLPGAGVVSNPDPTRGMLSSLQVGLQAALSTGARRVMFAPVDVPLTDGSAVSALLSRVGRAPVQVAAFEGRPGHPVLLEPEPIAALLAADPTAIARQVLSAFDAALVEVDDPGVIGNVNTPQDAARWQRTDQPGREDHR